jgi:PAB-dependent poly(A)-specific ribonuclease subunit 3
MAFAASKTKDACITMTRPTPTHRLPPTPASQWRQTGMTQMPRTPESHRRSALPPSRLNVESPSFTPLQPQPNGYQQQGRSSALSPRSASAAPFTPKLSKPSWSHLIVCPRADYLGPLSNAVPPKPTAPEWTPQEFPEFVPKSFDPSQASSQGEASYQSYDAYNMPSSISPPQPSVTNPYFPDPVAAMANPGFYQATGGFAQPVSAAAIR